MCSCTYLQTDRRAAQRAPEDIAAATEAVLASGGPASVRRAPRVTKATSTAVSNIGGGSGGDAVAEAAVAVPPSSSGGSGGYAANSAGNTAPNSVSASATKRASSRKQPVVPLNTDSNVSDPALNFDDETSTGIMASFPLDVSDI